VTEELAFITVELATSFNVLPEQIDLLSWVLTMSGVSALAGALVSAVRGVGRYQRALCVERCTIFGAELAVATFLLLYLRQELL
jgi:hypothetical protein